MALKFEEGVLAKVYLNKHIPKLNNPDYVVQEGFHSGFEWPFWPTSVKRTGGRAFSA
jgi:hypothetical protein